MTIRELYIKIIETIAQIVTEFLNFFLDLFYKLYTKQFLELTIDQVGVIVLILSFYFLLVLKFCDLFDRLFDFLDIRTLPSLENRFIVKLLIRATVFSIGIFLWVFWFYLDSAPKLSN